MLELYFVRPTTVDRIRASWMSAEIERYVSWLHERHFARAYVVSRVQILFHFGEYARRHRVSTIRQLPKLIEPFVRQWVASRHQPTHKGGTQALAARTRRPLRAMLRLVLRGFQSKPVPATPFIDQVPGYFPYLRQQRGLRERSLCGYFRHLRQFQRYLNRIGLRGLHGLTPMLITGFITESGQCYQRRSMAIICSVLKSFLHYLYLEKITTRDLRAAVEAPRHWRLAKIPRSISWTDVQKMLDGVDRRWARGRRDYAVLLLLVTYGLRAAEIAALSLDDLDWKRGRLHVIDRKAGHSTAYPLSPTVGDAIADYLQHGRPQTSDRHVLFICRAPYAPITSIGVSQIARRYLVKAGIQVHRRGSHTLRHTCVQRLVDAQVSLKTIGDYVGHRSASSTRIYSKIDVEGLREVALGDGEAVL